jgi:hypothetical protein
MTVGMVEEVIRILEEARKGSVQGLPERGNASRTLANPANAARC